ncbi:hypothetical protein NDA10_002009 [Ustilago hordei]|nr:hypothetical protein NDA10_002009 [Ustilago hordei]
MDSYGFTCKGEPSHMRGGPGTATRRTKLKEQAQPRRGPSSRSMQMVTTQGLERQEVDTGHEEEEQCRRSRHHSRGTGLGTIDINVMMTPRSGVSVDDDEVDGVGDEIGDVDDNEVDGVGDKVGGVNTSVQCVDLMLEVIPGPQWTTAFGSIYIRTANLLWAPSDVR